MAVLLTERLPHWGSAWLGARACMGAKLAMLCGQRAVQWVRQQRGRSQRACAPMRSGLTREGMN